MMRFERLPETLTSKTREVLASYKHFRNYYYAYWEASTKDHVLLRKCKYDYVVDEQVFLPWQEITVKQSKH